MHEPAHAVSIVRTLRLKVRQESYAWLNAAAVEVNTVWNWANETVFERSAHVLFMDEADRFNRVLEQFARTAFNARTKKGD